MVEFVGDRLISDYRDMQQNNTTDIANTEAELAYQVSRGVLSPEVVQAIRNSALGQDANMKLALQDFDRDRAEKADLASGVGNSLGSGPYSRLGSPMDLTGPMQNDADAQAGRGLTFGTGVGPAQVNLPSPVNETNQILNSEDTMFGANPTALQQQIDPDTYARELNQPYFSGPIATPGIDYNIQNVSVPGNTGPNNIDYDMTSFYESPVNYDMTSFYESPNTVAGVNTVQGVNQVENPSSGRSILDSVVDVAKLGPTGSALTVALDEEVPTSGRVGAGLFGLGNTLAGMAMGPVVGLLGLLGGGLNAMGAYHDVGIGGNLTGNQMTLTNNGTLYGLMDAPGGSFYQTGGLSNYNTIANAPANTMVNTGFGNFGTGLLTQAGQPGMDVNQAAYVAAMSQADDFSFGGDDSGGFSEGTSYGDEDSYG